MCDRGQRQEHHRALCLLPQQAETGLHLRVPLPTFSISELFRINLLGGKSRDQKNLKVKKSGGQLGKSNKNRGNLLS